MSYSIVEAHRGKIHHFYYDEFGKKHHKKVDFKPTVGLESEKEEEYKDIKGKNIKEKKFDSIYDFYKFINRNKDSINIYGNISPIYQYINREYQDKNDFNTSFLRTLFIDIEVDSEDGFPDPEIAAWPITSISIKDSITGKYYIAALKSFDKFKSELDLDPKLINFKKFEKDSQILLWLIKVFKYLKPDILVGWYAINFDYPYIINRFDYIFEDEYIKNELSPLGYVSCEYMGNFQSSNQNKKFRELFRTRIKGINLLDLQHMYMKFVGTFKPQPSYSLNNIASIELNENKIDYSEYNDLGDLWKKNPQKYIDYNIYDVELMYKLNEKIALIDLAAMIMYKAKCNMVDVMGTVKVWDVLLYNYLWANKIMIPPIRENEKHIFAGAYVKEPAPKIYDWIISYDLNSLYPHLQQQFNISPECLVYDEGYPVNFEQDISDNFLDQNLKANPNYIMAGNGCFFRKDIEGFIPKILREIYTERTVEKGKMLDEKQKLVLIKEELKKRQNKA